MAASRWPQSNASMSASRGEASRGRPTRAVALVGIVVDQAFDRVANDASVSGQNKTQLINAIMKQFEVSDVDRWSTVEFTRLFKVETKANSENRVMSLDYEIRNVLCCNLDIVLNYHNSRALPKSATVE